MRLRGIIGVRRIDWCVLRPTLRESCSYQLLLCSPKAAVKPSITHCRLSLLCAASHFTTILSILGHSPPFSQLGTKLCNLFFICVEYAARAACYAIIPPATPSISVSHITYDITFAPLAVMTLHPTTSFVRQVMHAPILRPVSIFVFIASFRYRYHSHTWSFIHYPLLSATHSLLINALILTLYISPTS
jgi:hypothetical protein